MITVERYLAPDQPGRCWLRVDAMMATAAPPPLLTAALAAGFGSYTQFYRAFRAARGRSTRGYYAQ